MVSIVADDVLFEPGSAHVEAAGSRALDAVAAALRSLDNQIAIEGHTDDRPISNSRFPSNWELSTARAGAVLRYLVDHHGLPPSRLSAAGYADSARWPATRRRRAGPRTGGSTWPCTRR